MAKRAKTVLAGLDFEALMKLRSEVEDRLQGYRSTLEQQLASLGGAIMSRVKRGRPAGRRSAMKGRKVAPKYRGPGGETWAGRGARPRWLVAAIKTGKKPEHFLIDTTTRRRAK